MSQPLPTAEYEPGRHFPGAYQLPVYKGYTVDFRLREFRKMPMDALPEFIPFDTERGDELLAEMLEKDLVTKEDVARIYGE